MSPAAHGGAPNPTTRAVAASSLLAPGRGRPHTQRPPPTLTSGEVPGCMVLHTPNGSHLGRCEGGAAPPQLRDHASRCPLLTLQV
ncbi:MAG: hypothetical protein WDW38_006103 [Sanguina aurantia]